MKEIKLRYVFKKPNGHIILYFTDIQHLEHGDIANFLQFNFLSIERDLINRDFYTGLKDKNGKEIYEGDIVKAQVNNCMWRYLVTTFEGFGNNLFYATRYRNFATDTESDYYKWGDYFVNEGRGLIQHGNEVIGNIYENPELLESPNT